MIGLGVLLHYFEFVDLAGIQAEPLATVMLVASGVNSLLAAIDSEAGCPALSGAAREPVNFGPVWWRSGRISSDLDAEEEKDLLRSQTLHKVKEPKLDLKLKEGVHGTSQEIHQFASYVWRWADAQSQCREGMARFNLWNSRGVSLKRSLIRRISALNKSF